MVRPDSAAISMKWISGVSAANAPRMNRMSRQAPTSLIYRLLFAAAHFRGAIERARALDLIPEPADIRGWRRAIDFVSQRCRLIVRGRQPDLDLHVVRRPLDLLPHRCDSLVRARVRNRKGARHRRG